MEINEMNYEMYAVDYAEDRLSGEEQVAMELFLDMHPELREEIQDICGTRVPEDPAYHGNLNALKRDHKTIALWYRPLAAASAAVLVIAVGFWFLNQRAIYGELASNQPAFNIHYSIELTYRDTPADGITGQPNSEGVEIPPKNKLEQNYKQTTIQADQLVASNAVHYSIDDGNKNIPDAKSIFANELSAQDETSNDVPYRVKMKIVDPVEVPMDEYYILPVTIELHELSLTGSKRGRAELDKLTALQEGKSNRRKLLKDGALSLFQQTIMPEGFNNLLSN